jgi:hypothetical protein
VYVRLGAVILISFLKDKWSIARQKRIPNSNQRHIYKGILSEFSSKFPKSSPEGCRKIPGLMLISTIEKVAK